ncbi:hypothetical protein [Mycolicibacterium hodleri]|uniref:hypothetical protein n=1 Tax=Mycolicibacterium hodleri TaxID=49897 RepID=UPI003D160EDC
MRNDATIDDQPLAEPRILALEVISPPDSSGLSTSISWVFWVGHGLVEFGNPKTQPRFETASLQRGSAPASFDAKAMKGCSTASFSADSRPDIAPTTFGGSSRTNPSRCFTAKPHPQSATFVAQCVESIQQLRGARIALARNIGGPTATLETTIVEGPGTNGG